jgi:phosphoribosylformimino-5-aminoimidazole carboxamide ribotide isomerase
VSRFTAIPAIDIRGGAVVRLRQGDYARESRYAMDPFALAMAYADAGAQWLHLVDLDAARDGGFGLEPLLARLASDGRLQVQLGGGVRDRLDVMRRLEAGATRVVVGSLAVERPDDVAAWIRGGLADRIVVALDLRRHQDDWRAATRGWTLESDQPPTTLVDTFRDAGLEHLLCTDIARDGMLAGPSLDLYEWLRARAPHVALQASGGIRDLVDLRHVARLGCAGAVLGRSLLDGSLSLAEALSC